MKEAIAPVMSIALGLLFLNSDAIADIVGVVFLIGGIFLGGTFWLNYGE